MECWYPDDLDATWGWRIRGKFDGRRETLRFFAEAPIDDLGPHVEYSSDLLSREELAEI